MTAGVSVVVIGLEPHYLRSYREATCAWSVVYSCNLGAWSKLPLNLSSTLQIVLSPAGIDRVPTVAISALRFGYLLQEGVHK